MDLNISLPTPKLILIPQDRSLVPTKPIKVLTSLGIHRIHEDIVVSK